MPIHKCDMKLYIVILGETFQALRRLKFLGMLFIKGFISKIKDQTKLVILQGHTVFLNKAQG